jgi:transcriptional regulator with XRE-family HTH domain
MLRVLAERQDGRLFPALLRHWRTRRGLSQLDLALAADVSARHVSFLENGRAQPSREMVLRLASTLDVPLREQNAMLVEAGFAAEFPEPRVEDGLAPAIESALARMLEQQEPFPLVVMDRGYHALRTNRAALRVLSRFVLKPERLAERPNMLRMVFDPELARPFVLDWERVARALLSRAHREALAHPGDASLGALVRSIFEYPDVPESFRQPDFSSPCEPTLAFRVRRGELELAFLTTVTVFNAPQNVTLDELRIESYFPLDDATTRACERLMHDD